MYKTFIWGFNRDAINVVVRKRWFNGRAKPETLKKWAETNRVPSPRAQYIMFDQAGAARHVFEDATL